MSSTPLCQWCARIPFHDIPSGDLDVALFHLYTGPRIKQSSCPLCQLIVEAYYQRHEDVLNEETVFLNWREGAGVGFAFWLQNLGQDVWISFGLLESTDYAAREMRAAHPRRCLVRPTTESLIDTSRVLGWILSCEQEHGDHCQLPTQVPFAEAFRGLPFVRLIDLQDACLVEMQHLVKYAALSYVWGAVANFRLTKANRPVLLMRGSLNKVSDRLPATIRDAIAFVQRLGCRYLWVDALCLMQNDADDLDQGVGAMDLIYERAWLTVVAACGHDANARLPGAQDGTRKPSINTHCVMPGIAMGVVVGLDDRLGCSIYDTRGWTFQERLLSRRAIYFVDDTLFYRCRGTAQAEHLMDLSNAPKPSSWALSHLPTAILMRDPVFDYSVILESYTKRILTNQSDAPRAMAGIIQRFSVAMGCRFLEGLPTATFDLFILFCSFRGSLHRRPAFPSYSWTGWSGSLRTFLLWIRPGYADTLQYNTWIIWYKRSPSAIVSQVWDPSCEPSFPLDDLRFAGYRERRSFSQGRYPPAGLDTSRTTPSETISFSRDVPPYHILQFWTISTFYTISGINVFDATGDLVDSNGEICGSVFFDGFEETTYLESQTHFEVIWVSESLFQPANSLENYSSSSYHSERQRRNPINVLLLEWQGGLAERRGFGCIFQEAIHNSLAPGPMWKEILLA